MAFTTEIDSLKRQIDDLKRKYETRKSEIRLESQTTIQPDIDKLNREKLELQTKLTSIQAEFNGKLHALMNERDILKKHINEYELRQKSQLELLDKERNVERAKAEAVIKSLQAEIATLRGGTQNQVGEMQKDIQRLIAQVEAEKKQNADLQAAFNKERAALLQEIQSLKSQNNELDKKKETVKEELKGDITQIQKQKNDKEEVLRTEIRELKAENNRFKKINAILESQKKDALKSQSRATVEIDRLRDIIDRNGRKLPFQNII
jgi:chromosome segregation ATPase